MVLSRPIPRNSLKDICLQHIVKIMLLDKTATFRSAHDKTRMQDPAVLLQRGKVEVLADPRIDAPSAAGGHREKPKTCEEVVAKARDLISPVLGSGACSILTEGVGPGARKGRAGAAECA